MVIRKLSLLKLGRLSIGIKVSVCPGIREIGVSRLMPFVAAKSLNADEGRSILTVAGPPALPYPIEISVSSFSLKK
jgi:hypothetical protein